MACFLAAVKKELKMFKKDWQGVKCYLLVTKGILDYRIEKLLHGFGAGKIARFTIFRRYSALRSQSELFVNQSD